MPASSHRLLKDRIAAGRRQGLRDYQEDNYLVVDLRESGADDEDAALLLLADGMGGHAGGAVASELAVNAFGSSFLDMDTDIPIHERLSGALDAANAAIASKIGEKPELEGMGCTLIAAVVYADRVQWLSVGDSPFWLFRNGALVRLNDDHSMKPVLAKLVSQGELTEKEAASDSRRNALRSAVDGSRPNLVDLRKSGYKLQCDDILLLASDGVETLTEREIIANLEASAHLDIADRLEILLDGVIDCNAPHQDNTTAILLEPVISEASRETAENRTVVSDRTQERLRVPVGTSGRSKRDTGASSGYRPKPTSRSGSPSMVLSLAIVVAAIVIACVTGFLAFRHFNNSPQDSAAMAIEPVPRLGVPVPPIAQPDSPPDDPGGRFEAEIGGEDGSADGSAEPSLSDSTTPQSTDIVPQSPDDDTSDELEPVDGNRGADGEPLSGQAVSDPEPDED
jgi:serine/threonine protein phosphatase PrpC